LNYQNNSNQLSNFEAQDVDKAKQREAQPNNEVSYIENVYPYPKSRIHAFYTINSKLFTVAA